MNYELDGDMVVLVQIKLRQVFFSPKNYELRLSI